MLLFALKLTNEEPDYLEVIIIIVWTHYERHSSAEKTLMLRNMNRGVKEEETNSKVDGRGYSVITGRHEESD